MSRSGYSDDCENLGLYRANVDRAIRGARGQAFLREMAAALDAMPVKELISEEIVSSEGQACAIGTVALARKMDVSKLDPDNQDLVAAKFGIARCLAAEIAYENDEGGPYFSNPNKETPADRWKRMRKWVDDQIRQEKSK